MDYLVGAGLGAGASQYQKYSRTIDPDGGQRYYKGGGRRRVTARVRGRSLPVRRPRADNKAKIIQRAWRRKKSYGGKKKYYTKRSNQGYKKQLQYKPKRRMPRYPSLVKKSILYPCPAVVTLFVGNGVTRSGSGAEVVMGNMNYRPLSESKSDDFSAFEVYDVTSLSGNSTSSNNQGEHKLLIGTQIITGSNVQSEILGAQENASTNRSKILTNGVSSDTDLLTVGHYISCTGLNGEASPNYLIAGFSINLQFQTMRQVDQMLCVRLVRVKQEALEDCWGQSAEGSTTLTGQNIANMVNSQYHINREKYEIVYQCRTTLKGQSAGGPQPKAVKIKKYIPCSYMSTRARKSWTATVDHYGANMKPIYKIEDGRFNKCYVVVTVRPLCEQVMASSTASNSGNFISNYNGIQGSGTGAAGQKVSACAYVNGICKTHYRFQSVLRAN